MDVEPDQMAALTAVERALVEHVARGVVLDLVGNETVDETAMRSWDESRTVRASVVRDILRGRLAPDPDPHGVRLRGARIAGRLDLENITSTVALKLRGCLLEEGLIARDADLPTLDLSGSLLEHPHEAPVDAVRLTTTVLSLARTVINGHNDHGAIRLRGAHLGELDCTGTKVRNDSGPALHAERLQVDQSAFLRGGFEAVGAGEQGAVRLRGAHLGHLSCTGAKVRNDSGPALHADHLQVDQSAFLRGGFDAVGAGKWGAVRLLGAHLGGQLDCTDAKVRNDSGPALHAERLQVDQSALLRGGFAAVGAGSAVTVNLAGVRVGGVLEFRPARLQHLTDPQFRLDVDGLSYTGLPQGISTDEWLQLLRDGTPRYAAQPYQHLTAAHRTAGHDSQARRILMDQRRDQIRRSALTSRTELAWARLTGLTLGYGYQPWRALLGLLAAITTAVTLAITLGGHGGLAHIQNPPTPNSAACTLVERIGTGLDLGTPSSAQAPTPTATPPTACTSPSP